MISLNEIELYEALREKMDEKAARGLIEYIELQVENKFDHTKSIFATKEDLLQLEIRLVGIISDSKLDTHKLIADSKAETFKMMASLDNKIALSAADMIKWMFVFVLTSTVSIISVMLVIMKILKW